MSRKSTKSSRRNGTTKKARGAIDPAVKRQARRIADGYTILLQPDKELGHIGSALEMPSVFADGSTAEQCVAATRQALMLAVASMIERKQTPPNPASTKKREAQINVRVTNREKMLLQEAARRRGFKGVGDFVRSTALANCDAA